MYKGWIKVHRSLLDKPIWIEATPEQKVVLVTVLTMANHKEKKWEWKGEIYQLQPGQFITSLASLVQKCGKGFTIAKIRTALKRFEKYEFIADKSSNRNRLITIVNWDLYQEGIGMQKSNLASKTQTTNNQIAPNKNVENEKNEKKLKPIQEPKISHDESSIYFQLAQTLYKHIQENHPSTKQPNFQRWSKQLCQLVENDRRTIEQIQQVITWTQTHQFWQTVVLSPAPMKRNWDLISAQIKQQSGKVQHLPTIPRNNIFLDFSKGEVL